MNNDLKPFYDRVSLKVPYLLEVKLGNNVVKYDCVHKIISWLILISMEHVSSASMKEK